MSLSRRTPTNGSSLSGNHPHRPKAHLNAGAQLGPYLIQASHIPPNNNVSIVIGAPTLK
jgi:hypothetical protein